MHTKHCWFDPSACCMLHLVSWNIVPVIVHQAAPPGLQAWNIAIYKTNSSLLHVILFYCSLSWEILIFALCYRNVSLLSHRDVYIRLALMIYLILCHYLTIHWLDASIITFPLSIQFPISTYSIHNKNTFISLYDQVYGYNDTEIKIQGNM